MFEEQQDVLTIDLDLIECTNQEQQYLKQLLQTQQSVYKEILLLQLQINHLHTKQELLTIEKKAALELKEQIITEARNKINFFTEIKLCNELKSAIYEKKQITDLKQRLEERTILSLKLARIKLELAQKLQQELENRKIAIQLQNLYLQELEKKLQSLANYLNNLNNKLLEKHLLIINLTQTIIDDNQTTIEECTFNNLLYLQQSANYPQPNSTNISTLKEGSSKKLTYIA